MKFLTILGAWLFTATLALGAPITTYPAATTPYSGTEQILGTQPAVTGKTVNFTPAGLAAYTVSSGASSAAVGCLSIFAVPGYQLTDAQIAAVKAGTSALDFLPIFQAAILAVSAPISANAHAGPQICIPLGKYPFSSTLDIQNTVVIRGAGGGGGLAGTPSATQLVFPNDTSGIIIDQSGTTLCASSSSTTSGAGTVISDLAVVGGGTSTAANGIHLCARAVLTNINLTNFPGKQLWVDGNSGNVNEASFTNINCASSMSDWCVYEAGNDANANSYRSIGVLSSGGGGICACSFLGSSYHDVHIDSWGAKGLGEVTQTGHKFALVSRTAGIGASTTPTIGMTTPWYDEGAGSGPPAWSGSGTYQVSAGIFSDGVVSNNVFYSPYMEPGYPISQISKPAFVVQPVNGGLTSTSPQMAVAFGLGGFFYSPLGFGGYQPLPSGDTRGTYQYANVRPDGLLIGNQVGTALQIGDVQQDVGIIHYQFNSFRDAMEMTGANNTALNFGRTAAVPYVTSVNLLAVGNGNLGRIMTNGTALPSTTGDAKGELVWNSNAGIGQPMGWVETTQGTPDIWAPLPTIPLAMGATGTITGTALTATCDSGTATVTGATVGRPVSVSATDGVDVGGAFDLRASVTSTNTVSVYICGTGTPASKAYNVKVHQ